VTDSKLQRSLLFFSHSYRSDPVNFIRRRIVSCSQTKKTGLVPLRAVVSADQGSVVQGLATLADQLRLGSLTEDGLSYKEKFVVRSYEVGSNKTATVETIANLLQVRYKFFTLCVCVCVLMIGFVVKYESFCGELLCIGGGM